MQDKMKSLHDNYSYDLVKFSKGKRDLENDVGKDILQIEKLKKWMGESFSMKDMGEPKEILGIIIMCERKNKKIYMSQDGNQIFCRR